MGEEVTVASPAEAVRRWPRRSGRRGVVGGPEGSVRFSAAVARRICERLMSGETLTGICADQDMPHRSSVRAWAQRLPAFARALDRARASAGWHGLGGRRPLWCEQTALEICARLAAGETLTKVCDDPTLPSLSLVYRWRGERPEFAEALELARQVQAERFCDLGWDIASAVTPQDAYATHVKLTQLRWTAAAMAPARFGRFKPVVAEAEAEAELAEAGPSEVTFHVRHFERVTGADGQDYVRELQIRED